VRGRGTYRSYRCYRSYRTDKTYRSENGSSACCLLPVYSGKISSLLRVPLTNRQILRALLFRSSSGNRSCGKFW